jgi:hypothetical protein
MDAAAWTALVTACLGGLATLVVAVATLVAAIRARQDVREVRRELNGRLDQLLAAERELAALRARQPDGQLHPRPDHPTDPPVHP